MRARKAASDKVYLAESMEEVRAAREELAYLESVIQTSYEHMRDKVEEAAVTKMVPDPKFFYEFAKRNAKVRSQIGPLVTEDGSHTSDPGMVAADPLWAVLLGVLQAQGDSGRGL